MCRGTKRLSSETNSYKSTLVQVRIKLLMIPTSNTQTGCVCVPLSQLNTPAAFHSCSAVAPEN